MSALDRLRHHVTGAIERGESVAIVEQRAPLEWSALWSAMRPEPHPWIATTSEMYDEMLGALPPADMGGGAFLVGEANHHNAAGDAVYACFKRVGLEFEARYMTRAEFREFKAIRSAQLAA